MGEPQGVFLGREYCQWVNLGGNLYFRQSNQGRISMVSNYYWRKLYKEGIDMGGNSIGGTFFGREIVFWGNLKRVLLEGGNSIS